jgi:hypothetical protein
MTQTINCFCVNCGMPIVRQYEPGEFVTEQFVRRTAVCGACSEKYERRKRKAKEKVNR